MKVLIISSSTRKEGNSDVLCGRFAKGAAEAGCPKQIAIPDLFAVMNTKQIYHDWNADYYYNVLHTGGGKAKASECIKCGKCEKACPQHLHIRELLKDVANEFENR